MSREITAPEKAFLTALIAEIPDEVRAIVDQLVKKKVCSLATLIWGMA